MTGRGRIGCSVSVLICLVDALPPAGGEGQGSDSAAGEMAWSDCCEAQAAAGSGERRRTPERVSVTGAGGLAWQGLQVGPGRGNSRCSLP